MTPIQKFRAAQLAVGSVAMAAYTGMTMMADDAQEPVTQVPPGQRTTAEFSFNFRTEKIRDEKGEVIGEGKKRESVKAVLPVPTDAQLIDFIGAQGKEAEFLRDVVYEAIARAARAQINDQLEENKEAVITAASLDLSKLTFTAIANQAPESRAKAELPEEVYNTFYEDYKTVMVNAGKELGRVQKHIVLFKNQFLKCKFDKAALQVLKDNLNVWAAKTEAMEDNAEVYNVLVTKADKYLKAEDKNLVAAL